MNDGSPWHDGLPFHDNGLGMNCADYVREGYCGPSGLDGEYKADEACCGCGGGDRGRFQLFIVPKNLCLVKIFGFLFHVCQQLVLNSKSSS